MMRITYYLIFNLVFSSILYSQSGYLGSRNSIALEFNMGPSVDLKVKFQDDELRYSREIINPSYKIIYGRTLTDKITLSLSYRYTAATVVSRYSQYTPFGDNGGFGNINFTMLEDPKMSIHSGEIEFKFYRRGSLAPTGKYLGISVNLGTSQMRNTNELGYGLILDTKSTSVFSEVYDVIKFGEGIIDVNQRISFSQLRGLIGRSYPLNDFLMINTGMSFPIISMYDNALGFLLNSFYNNNSYLYDDNSTFLETMRSTSKKYTRIMAFIGISFHF